MHVYAWYDSWMKGWLINSIVIKLPVGGVEWVWMNTCVHSIESIPLLNFPFPTIKTQLCVFILNQFCSLLHLSFRRLSVLFSPLVVLSPHYLLSASVSHRLYHNSLYQLSFHSSVYLSACLNFSPIPFNVILGGVSMTQGEKTGGT